VLVFAAVVGSAGPADAATHDIGFSGNSLATYAYNPATLRIPAGDTVRWQATGFHPLVFNSGGAAITMTEVRTLNTPGVVAFYCQNHGPQVSGGMMAGTVTVDAPPMIKITRETAAPRAGEPVSFRAIASDPENMLGPIVWDMDGDGNFELTGPAASASFAAGSHTVSARVTDDLGTPATAADTFTVTGPAGSGGGSGSPGGGPDTKKPALSVKARSTIRARKLRRRGVKLTLTASEDGRLVAVLRNKRGRRVGRATAQADAGKATALRVRARRAKPGHLTLRIKAIDAADNRKTVKRSLTVT
jgi:plastocyanin